MLSHTLISLAPPEQLSPENARILKERAPEPKHRKVIVFPICMIANLCQIEQLTGAVKLGMVVVISQFLYLKAESMTRPISKLELSDLTLAQPHGNM